MSIGDKTARGMRIMNGIIPVDEVVAVLETWDFDFTEKICRKDFAAAKRMPDRNTQVWFDDGGGTKFKGMAIDFVLRHMGVEHWHQQQIVGLHGALVRIFDDYSPLSIAFAPGKAKLIEPCVDSLHRNYDPDDRAENVGDREGRQSQVTFEDPCRLTVVVDGEPGCVGWNLDVDSSRVRRRIKPDH